MNRRASAMIFLLVVGAFTAVHAASAQDPGYYPIELAVGESYEVCKTGAIVCPATSAFCDDPKVVVPVDLPGGLGFKGVSPGKTLCSAGSAVGPRRVFSITVR
ncbi:MAG: hypothetical protein IH611_12690 [Deltaproteobacteria bacterium]|nr:hypothetical protein [Deltaproteobacteria bacterium]